MLKLRLLIFVVGALKTKTAKSAHTWFLFAISVIVHMNRNIYYVPPLLRKSPRESVNELR